MKRHRYDPSRSAEAIRTKARHAFGRQLEAEQDEVVEAQEAVTEASTLPRDPKRPPPPRVDPLTGLPIRKAGTGAGVEKSGLEFLKQAQGTKIAPAGLEQIDRDAASEIATAQRGPAR